MEKKYKRVVKFGLQTAYGKYPERRLLPQKPLVGSLSFHPFVKPFPDFNIRKDSFGSLSFHPFVKPFPDFNIRKDSFYSPVESKL